MAAACDDRETKRAHTARGCWSATVPDDLLPVVYRVVASPRGRTRFAAVCRSWRAAARAAPPVPVLPWLLFLPHYDTGMKTLHCPEDGALVRLRVPGEDAGRWIIGCHDGGWVALLERAGPVRIMNLFSGAEVALYEKKVTILCPSRDHANARLVFISKLIFSAPPTSPQCILAGVTHKCGIALCKAGCSNSGWTVQGCPDKGKLDDMAFCNGELYGLRRNTTLVKFEIGMNEDGAPTVTAERNVGMETIDHTIAVYRDCTSYIFDLHGKPGMALKTQWLRNTPPFFKVFKLADIHMGRQKALYKREWLEVTSLGDHSLFLGEIFSKAVHVSANGRGDVKRNRIYYSDNCWFGTEDFMPGDVVSVAISNDSSSVTCHKEDDSKCGIPGDGLKRIIPVRYIMKGCIDGGMWILPPDI